MFNLIYRWARSSILGGGVFLLRILYSFDLPREVQLGKNIKFYHKGLGTVISPFAILGDEVKIQHHVTIGIKDGNRAPKIGNNVYIGAHAIILGDITIGDNAVIGAGTIVLNDVEPNTICVNDVKMRTIYHQ